MAAALFAVAFFVVAGLLVARRLRASARRRRHLAAEGRSPGRPWSITRFDEIDAKVSSERCTCGGRLSVISEGSRTLDGHSARVVHCECLECEEEHDLFFVQTMVLH